MHAYIHGYPCVYKHTHTYRHKTTNTRMRTGSIRLQYTFHKKATVRECIVAKKAKQIAFNDQKLQHEKVTQGKCQWLKENTDYILHPPGSGP